MTLGITGASGFIGKAIIDLALRRGHEVIAFTRRPERAIPGCTMRAFSLDRAPDISGCDAIIHLAGEPILGLWTPAKKRRIIDSRVQGTRRIVEAINGSKAKPEVLVCGSAIGYYGDARDKELTEQSPAGSGFLAETVRAWETEALQAEGVRTVLLRTALVLGKGSGALSVMAPLFRAALGGSLGDGQQWMSWIHLEDEARLALFAVENLDLHGPLNASAPWPVRNADFTKTLALTLHRPALFRVPAFALRLLGDLSHELLDSKRVLPAAALEHGYGFRFSELEPALKNLLA
ncbi:MAG: TIGR01777 family oxidoreductase [Chthoniobacteraceae bacterium]